MRTTTFYNRHDRGNPRDIDYEIVQSIRELINDPAFIARHRRSETDFTRHRTLPLRVLSKQWQGEFCRCSIDVVGGKQCDGRVDHLERFRHNAGPSAKAGKPMTQTTVNPLNRHRFILADICRPTGRSLS